MNVLALEYVSSAHTNVSVCVMLKFVTEAASENDPEVNMMMLDMKKSK